jgi:endoglucanase
MLLGLTLLSLMLAAGSATAARVASGPSVASGSLVPSSGVWFGGHVHKRTEKTEYDAVLALEKEIGRKFAIDEHYEHWTNPTLKEESLDVAAGRIPMVSWPSGSWPSGVDASAILSGSQDGAITYMARQLKALGHPVLLRFAYEMDHVGGGRYIGPPSVFIPAWRHVHDLFVAAGATNVKWVWCAVSHNFANGSAQTYYPGDAYVDWIAADGFSFWPVQQTSNGTWRSLDQIFSAFYGWGSGKSKPLMIASTGVQEDPTQPSRKSQWFQDAATTLKSWPKVKAIVYYHSTIDTPFGVASFYGDSSSKSLNAYAAMGAESYFSPPVP